MPCRGRLASECRLSADWVPYPTVRTPEVSSRPRYILWPGGKGMLYQKLWYYQCNRQKKIWTELFVIVRINWIKLNKSVNIFQNNHTLTKNGRWGSSVHLFINALLSCFCCCDADFPSVLCATPVPPDNDGLQRSLWPPRVGLEGDI